jgi:uncharacterized protein (DUF58 family)
MRSPFPALRQRLNARAARWALRRQGMDALPLELRRRRIYILPTRAGLGFGALLFVMLLAGLNYANSLALIATFSLASFVLVAMNLCHRNLMGLRISSATPLPAFAGDDAVVELSLENVTALDRYSLFAAINGREAELIELVANHSARLRMPIATQRRGRQRIDRIRIATDFPFGLFRAWTWLHLPIDLTVYPRPRGEQATPRGASGREASAGRVSSGVDEWSGLRPFRDGDSPRQVDWKAYAREQPLLVKEYRGAAAENLDFSLQDVRAAEPEARLEQLARWVCAAESRGARYSLTLPGTRVGADHGAAHRHRCLEALAFYDLPRAREDRR